MRKKIELNAILDKDIQNFLEEYGIYKEFIEGNLKCNCCEEVISMENLGGIKLEHDKLLFFCNQPECLEELTKNYE